MPDNTIEAENDRIPIAPAWLTYEQASRYVNLSRCTLWRASKRGELTVAKVGRAARIWRESLDGYMLSRCL